MLSGGRDSVCLLDVAVALRGPGRVARCTSTTACARRPTRTSATARPCASRSASSSRCVARAPIAGAAARARGTCRRGRATCATRAAERMARGEDALIATGHTASDQVETILYRLAASPGRRALLGMVAREGRLVRPLLDGHARADRRLLRGARAAVARGREQRRRALRARARAPRAGGGAARGAPGGRGERAADRAAAARGDRAARRSRGAETRRGVRASRSRALAELPAALARLVVVRLAEDAAGDLRAAGRRSRAGDPRARRRGGAGGAARRRQGGRGDRGRRPARWSGSRRATTGALEPSRPRAATA